LKIHKEADNCKFCNSNLDYSAIKLKITQYKENKKHQATEKLKQFKKELQNLFESINLFEKESKNYAAIIGNVVDQYITRIIEKKNKIDSLITTCQSKIEKIENQEHFDFQLLTEILNEIDESITYINTIKIYQITKLRKKHLNLTSLVKGSIGLEIVKSVIIKDKLKEVKLKDDELKEKRNSNSTKQKEIQKYKQNKSLTKDFADFVSLILNDINISLKVSLGSDDRNYIIKSTNENATLTLKNISEGEKNLLSLLFFYYELFADNKQKQIKTDIELIIVDDPISSMDDLNKFYILELVKNLLELPDQQVFVLTHSWEDYCNISYGRKSWEKSQPYATFEIRKNRGRSEFSQLKNIEKPYKYLFKEIFVFSQKTEVDIITDCQIYHYPNVMRRVFEEWYSFKIGKDLNLTSSQQERLTSELEITENREKTKLGLLLKVCNILSHSINGSKNPQEIHQAAKYLMILIAKNDKLHYNNMKQ
jgi:hypothetical protein